MLSVTTFASRGNRWSGLVALPLMALPLVALPLVAGCAPGAPGETGAPVREPAAAEAASPAPVASERPRGEAPAETGEMPPVVADDGSVAEESAERAGSAAAADDVAARRAAFQAQLAEAQAQAQEAPPRRPAFRRPGEVEEITFEDLLLDMDVDIAFDPSMLTERAKELDNQRVRIRGFLYPGIFQSEGITEFPLLRNTECKFGPGGNADHLILVTLRDGLTTSYTIRPITVEGVLSIDPFDGPDGNTWAVFRLIGDRVER